MTKSIFPLANFLKTVQVKLICLVKDIYKLEKKYAPALDNYCQSCFVRNDFKKMKCVLNKFIIFLYIFIFMPP
jgi:hypothetical protein